MKKLGMLLVAVIFVFSMIGCTAEWYKHDTVYKTNDHMFFSWWGYDNPDEQDFQNQKEQGGWWGDEVLYIPAE